MYIFFKSICWSSRGFWSSAMEIGCQSDFDQIAYKSITIYLELPRFYFFRKQFFWAMFRKRSCKSNYCTNYFRLDFRRIFIWTQTKIQFNTIKKDRCYDATVNGNWLHKKKNALSLLQSNIYFTTPVVNRFLTKDKMN